MPDLPVLTPVEQRLLGALLEKQVTVPASYPLSLNSLRTACNQTSSRDPASDYDETTVEQTARSLKDRGLVRIVWSDSGRRTLKYHQVLDEVLGLRPDERALVTVLLLRGPQPAGALRTRTERLHPFADRGEVEECLARLAAAEPPLVQVLPTRAREQDPRWIHLLGPVEAGSAAVGVASAAGAVGAVDREVVLAEGGEQRDARVRASYGAVAATYAERLSDELGDLPFESWLLRRVADLADGAPVVEVGCGPGHVTAFLAAAGADASGLDLTPEMIEEARRRHPGVPYDVGDLRRLMRPATSDGWGAVLAWYSLIHLAASELPEAVAALTRPMRAGGWLVLALHVGTEVLHADDWFDHPIDLDFVLHDPAEVVALVESAGLVDVEWYHRGAVSSRGENNQRLYVLARTQ